MKTYQFRVYSEVSEYWEVQAENEQDARDYLFDDGHPVECTRDESILDIEFIEEADE